MIDYGSGVCVVTHMYRRYLMNEDSFKLYKHKLDNGVTFYVMCIPANKEEIEHVLKMGDIIT